MARKKSKYLPIDQIPEPARSALSAQPEALHPTRHQYHQWAQFIKWDMDPDPGGWWYGYCPMHDAGKSAGHFTARFKWDIGSMKCNQDPACHASQKAMSLANVALRANHAPTE